MAKCFLCNSRKGKRKCNLGDGLVCSECCGENRTKERCEGCMYFREIIPQRRYQDLPRFSVQEMDSDPTLQSYAFVIESTLCRWDYNNDRSLTDPSAIRVLELLLDKYYFGDSDVSQADVIEHEGFVMVVQAIKERLRDIPNDTLVKTLGVIRFVAKRRTNGGARVSETYSSVHRVVTRTKWASCAFFGRIGRPGKRT